MDIQRHWQTIRKIVNQALKSNRFCSVATVGPDGSPHVAPIGSLVMGEAGTAVYFEQFVKSTRTNLDRDERICVLAVAGGFGYWLKALFKGRFDEPSGVRLIGHAGARRMATDQEMKQWLARIRPFRGLRGYNLLWKDMRYVREVTFETFEPLRLGVMGRGVWEDEEGQSERNE